MPLTLMPVVRKLEREAALSAQEKEAVLALPVTLREMRADHDVVCEGDKPTQCCLVLNGWLHRYKTLENGTRQIFSFHVPGDMPDLQGLYLEIMDHSLAALVQSRVAFVQHDSMRNLIRSFPRLGELLWRDMLIDAAIFRQWMIGIGRKDAPQRIAHLLLELFTKMKAVGLTDGNSCNFPVTQATMGDALGLSTVHVNRSVMELRGRGLITLEKHTLTILDWEELRQYSEFDSHYLHMQPAAEAA